MNFAIGVLFGNTFALHTQTLKTIEKMKTIFTLLLVLFTHSVFATELKYAWQSGETYRFQATVNDDITMSMNMMGMSQSNTDRFATTSTFSLHIKSVDAAGTASAILFVEAFEVKDASGKLLASMRDIPAQAVKTDVKVDAKGRFEWVKKVTMLMTDEGSVLVSGSATENGVQASGQAGGQKVEVYAEFDPKTGQLKAGYSVSEVKQTKSKTVEVTQDTPEIDILPYAFLELMALPEGQIQQGDELHAQAGQMKTAVKATSLAGGVAALNISMATEKSQSMTQGSMQSRSGGSDMDMDMDMGMEDDFDDGFDDDFDDDFDSDFGEDTDLTQGDPMSAGMDPQDRAIMEGGMQSMPDMTADITSRFNYERGMFVDLSGTVTTEMDAMGMKMQTKSVLQMKEL